MEIPLWADAVGPSGPLSAALRADPAIIAVWRAEITTALAALTGPFPLPPDSPAAHALRTIEGRIDHLVAVLAFYRTLLCGHQ